MVTIPSAFFAPLVIILSLILISSSKFIRNKKVAKTISIIVLIILLVVCLMALFGYFS